ncbi:MAG: hypothetical protein CMK09_16840 [Ponticaulis sp.]|nr:hypothetical protein [Ponticaulis sp.]|tara:strand:+ start:356 stop:835 length:480 start_codon:yes stop_codon:yes gene_type:complete
MDGDWFGMAASAAGGGVFGVVGTVLGRVAGYFEAQQQHVFDKSRWQHETEMVRLNLEVGQAKSEAEQELASLQGSWAGLRSSLEAEVSLTSSYPLVNAIRALTRPALTLLLWVITALVFFNVETDMKARIVETSVFAATAATLWWFGDRTGPAHRPRPA